MNIQDGDIIRDTTNGIVVLALKTTVNRCIGCAYRESIGVDLPKGLDCQAGFIYVKISEDSLTENEIKTIKTL